VLEILNDVERDCLNRYVALLSDRLGDRLLGVSVYGSVARDEHWPRQLGPVFRTPERLGGAPFWENVRKDAIAIWPEAAT
jgi:hypothetical protein